MSAAAAKRYGKALVKQPPGPPLILGHARARRAAAAASCLNDACRHEGLIDVSKFPADTEVPSFAGKAVCAKYGSRGRHIDVRPNWKKRPTAESLTEKQWQ